MLIPSFHIFKIQKSLPKLQLSASAGPDGISSIFFFFKCTPTISYPLLLLYCKCLTSMSVPSMWKNANVMTLFKGGIHLDPLNYRLISLTSVCCKTYTFMIM